MKAVIKLHAEDARKARSLVRATIPDNIHTPRHLRIRSSARGRQVTFGIESSRLDTLVATVDDLLSCVQAAEKSMNALRRF